MLRSTTLAILVLGIGGIVFLGGACNKVATNTNGGTNAANTNAVLNSNVATNTVVNSNQNTNSNENTNVAEVDTSDWQTYTNTDYGFSFRYPGDFRVELETNQFGEVASSYGDLYIHSTSNTCYIQLTKPNTEEYQKILMAEENDKYGNHSDINKVSFGDVEGVIYTDTVNEQHEKGTVYKLYINGLGFTYLIRIGSTDQNCKKISNNILGSIK